MAVYICGICDDYNDDDENPGTAYGDNELICGACVEDLWRQTDEQLGSECEDWSEEMILSWAFKNL